MGSIELLAEENLPASDWKLVKFDEESGKTGLEVVALYVVKKQQLIFVHTIYPI